MTTTQLDVLPVPVPTPRLHLRLVQQALPRPDRLSGKNIAKAALQLALTMPIADALTQAMLTLADQGSVTREQAERFSAAAMKLICEGLRPDDAVSVALHERGGQVNNHGGVPEAIKSRLFPPQLTGHNVVKLAMELNATGLKMDDAIVQALHKFSAPRPMTPEQTQAVLDAAQRLFAEGLRAAEAFNIALRKTLPKGHCEPSLQAVG